MEIVRVEEADLDEIERRDSLRDSFASRTFRSVSHALTVEVIVNDIDRAKRRRVIVICNTVSQAQGLFKDLAELATDELKITLLHSRFLPEHRAQKESYLKQQFDRDWQKYDDGICHILIATQVIEAGLNITCEAMHVHLCPMNSLLQRAGRCARFQGEKGEVFIYRTIEIKEENSELAAVDLEEEAPKKKQKFLPYKDDICELTWEVLELHSQSDRADRNVGFRTEEEWIDRVHQDEDSLQAERRKNDRAEFDRNFHDAIFKGDRSTADDLIRDVDSRSIFVWEQPIFLDDEQIDPRNLLAFSVPTSTLCKVWREVQNLEYEIEIFKRIEIPKGKAAETYIQPVCTPIKSREALVTSAMILVNPRYLRYDDEIGLTFGVDVIGNNFSSPDKPSKQLKSEYKYQMDNYVGHLVLMWKCWRESFRTMLLKNGELVEIEYASVREEMLQSGGRFIGKKIFPNATLAETEALFEYLVMLAIFTHDLGKLQVKWQQVMHGWQAIAQRFGGRNPKSHLLAHTDYNPEDKRQKDALKDYEAKHKRPNHAVESAFLAQYILQQYLVPLLRDNFAADSEQIGGICYTIIMAAGRHHSAWSKGWETKDIRKVGDLQLHPEAQSAIASSWRSLVRFMPDTLPLPAQPPNLSQTRYSVRELDLNKFSNAQINYLQLYSLVVRALRLCDMRSVQTFDTGKI